MNRTLDRLILIAQLMCAGVFIPFFLYGAISYPGQLYIYLLFSILSFVVLISGFTRRAIFFDTFFSLFLFIGFWIKLNFGLVFNGGKIVGNYGRFDNSPAAFDEVLIVSSLGFAGLLAARYIRQRFMFHYQGNPTHSLNSLFSFYERNRSFLLSMFVFSILLVTALNWHLGVYQRGLVTQTTLPFGLNSLFKWLLLFGFASVSCLFLMFEYQRKGSESYLVAIIAVCENFLSGLSLLSRGMILNSGALVYGFYKSSKAFHHKLKFKFFIPLLLFIFLAVIGSALSVNYARSFLFQEGPNVSERKYIDQKKFTTALKMSGGLFIERWVGIDGVMAVSANERLGWSFLEQALSERFSPERMSFYDSQFLASPQVRSDRTKQHFISLPGFIAFSYYSGSLLFVPLALMMVCLFAALIEGLAYRLLGSQFILLALFGQVLAYRLINFGYVPGQSYLLITAIIFNILLFYFANRLVGFVMRDTDHNG